MIQCNFDNIAFVTTCLQEHHFKFIDKCHKNCKCLISILSCLIMQKIKQPNIVLRRTSLCLESNRHYEDSLSDHSFWLIPWFDRFRYELPTINVEICVKSLRIIRFQSSFQRIISCVLGDTCQKIPRKRGHPNISFQILVGKIVLSVLEYVSSLENFLNGLCLFRSFWSIELCVTLR